MTTDAPEWFASALSARPSNGTTTVDGCTIAFSSWGNPSHPPLVLIHGAAAHRRWWDFLAPLFAATHHVVALDISGHGDSGRRETYAVSQWGDEAISVLHHVGASKPAVLLGHSMGGKVAALAAHRHADAVSAVIMADTPVQPPDDEAAALRASWGVGSLSVYSSLDEARSRFSLVPRQPLPQPFICDHLVATSLQETPQGWEWKFDIGIFSRRVLEPAAPIVASLACRLALLYGEMSVMVADELVAYQRRLLPGVPFVGIPQAHHHLILDQPLAFVTAVRAVLALWATVDAPPRTS